MSKRFIVCVLPCLMLFTWLYAFGQRGGAPRLTISNLPDNAQSRADMEAAKKLVNGDPVLMKAWNFFCTPTEYNKPGQEVEAMKVFDNLYAIPSSPTQQTTVWAITTSDGIILIDSGQQGRTDAIIAELKQVGLNPADVKYILLGHGHGDHYAGAAYFQEHYGTRVGTAAADWNLIYPANPPANRGNQNQIQKPKRDLVLEEGKPVKLGEETVHVVAIPGHTPGSLAYIFNVTENGQTHTAGLFGGTILDETRITTDGLKQYIRSINHYLQIAKGMKVDVEIQNHALFDDTPGRLAKLKMRKAGEPNPFLMSPEKYANLWNIVSGCIEAEIARRPADRSN